MSAIALTISNTPVRQDSFGRFCLNDLHKAAGGEEKHSPNRFTRSDNYQSLIDELTPDLAFAPVESVRGGKNPGTYGCKEIVYSYAMWISAKFHIAVIRAYDAMVTGTPTQSPTISKAQIGDLYNKVAAISSGSGKIRAELWSRFQNHFNLSSYKDLPADKYDEAVEYLNAKKAEYLGGPVEMLYISSTELDAKVQEKVKAIQGELLERKEEPTTDCININMREGQMMRLSFKAHAEPQRYFVDAFQENVWVDWYDGLCDYRRGFAENLAGTGDCVPSAFTGDY
jgi:hypothetical protein